MIWVTSSLFCFINLNRFELMLLMWLLFHLRQSYSTCLWPWIYLCCICLCSLSYKNWFFSCSSLEGCYFTEELPFPLSHLPKKSRWKRIKETSFICTFSVDWPEALEMTNNIMPFKPVTDQPPCHTSLWTFVTLYEHLYIHQCMWLHMPQHVCVYILI